MPGRDPAKGARDTGRTDKGLGGGRRDTSSAGGGGIGRSRAGLVGNSETAKKNRERTGFRDPTARGAIDNPTPTDMSTAIPNYPNADALYGPTRFAQTAIGAIAGGGVGAVVGPALTEAGYGFNAAKSFGLSPGERRGWARGPGGFDQNNDPGNSSGLGGGRVGADSDAAAARREEEKRRREAAKKTALGSDVNSLLGPGVQPI